MAESLHATNDIGQIAIAVFITDSTADEATRKKDMARIAKGACDAVMQDR
jgi:hypothetical protein